MEHRTMHMAIYDWLWLYILCILLESDALAKCPPHGRWKVGVQQPMVGQRHQRLPLVSLGRRKPALAESASYSYWRILTHPFQYLPCCIRFSTCLAVSFSSLHLYSSMLSSLLWSHHCYWNRDNFENSMLAMMSLHESMHWQLGKATHCQAKLGEYGKRRTDVRQSRGQSGKQRTVAIFICIYIYVYIIALVSGLKPRHLLMRFQQPTTNWHHGDGGCDEASRQSDEGCPKKEASRRR